MTARSPSPGWLSPPDHTAFTLRERRGVYTRAHIDPYETETLEHPEPEPWNNYVSTVRTRG